jgi:hypothetical protein
MLWLDAAESALTLEGLDVIRQTKQERDLRFGETVSDVFELGVEGVLTQRVDGSSEELDRAAEVVVGTAAHDLNCLRNSTRSSNVPITHASSLIGLS